VQLIDESEAEGGELRGFVTDALEAYLRRGIFAHGFLRVRWRGAGRRVSRISVS